MRKRRGRINLRSYQAFEAVARHGSVTKAAVELGITQSAVSQQLRALKERTGKELLERRGPVVALTDEGKRLSLSLRSAFDIIEQQVECVEAPDTIVRLGVYSSFACPWLIARLPDFYRRHPAIDLRIVMLGDPHDQIVPLADIFVTSQDAQPGYAVTRLAPERLVPVTHIDGPDGFSAPVDLISAEVEPGIAGRAWEAFAALNGIDIGAVQAGEYRCCSHYIFAVEMVRAGMGAALLPDFMVAQEIADGRLKRLPGKPLPTGQIYALQMLQERRHDPMIVAVTQWLRKTILGAGGISQADARQKISLSPRRS